MKKVIRGEVVSFGEDLRVALHIEAGAVAVDGNGRIGWVGAYTALPEEWRAAPVEDHGRKLVLPGFIDAHIHFPQYRMLAAPERTCWTGSAASPSRRSRATPMPIMQHRRRRPS